MLSHTPHADQTKRGLTPAQIEAEDRADVMRQMAEQIEDWSDVNRQACASLPRANPFDMPLPLRDELLKRLN